MGLMSSLGAELCKSKPEAARVFNFADPQGLVVAAGQNRLSVDAADVAASAAAASVAAAASDSATTAAAAAATPACSNLAVCIAAANTSTSMMAWASLAGDRSRIFVARTWLQDRRGRREFDGTRRVHILWHSSHRRWRGQ